MEYSNKIFYLGIIIALTIVITTVTTPFNTKASGHFFSFDWPNFFKERPSESFPISDTPVSSTSSSTPIKNFKNHKTDNIIEPINFKDGYIHLPILMYHYIRNYQNPNDELGIGLSVSPATFRHQLDKISQLGFKTITFSELKDLEKMPAGPTQVNSIILTFDDGYEDFYTEVFPELKKRKIKAVVYLIINRLNTPGYLTDEQVKEMISGGLVEIGDHTFNHPNLTKLEEPKLSYEVAGSKKELEKRFNAPIVSFCYPSGQFNSFTEEEVKKSGFEFGVTTLSGHASTQYNLSLYRIRVKEQTDLNKILYKEFK